MNHQGVVFHPDFPNYWQVVESNARVYAVLPPFHPDIEQQPSSHDENHHPDHYSSLLLPNQVVRGEIWDATWIRLFHTGSFVARAEVQPYFPVYHVVANTHADANGVAPYVEDDKMFQSKDAWKCYDPNSPLRREDLEQPVGHVFDRPPLLLATTNHTASPPSNKWWTMDGQAWWPKTVRNQIPCTQVYFPNWIPALGSKTVTEYMTPVESTFIRTCFSNAKSVAWIVAMILLEYVMIVVGALAGVEYGWSAGLQLIYLVCLVLLVFCEIGLVAWLVPNGSLWVKMNLRGKLVGSILKGILWRWDLYGDVGFCILAYQQRERILARFWIVPTALTALVIASRLVASVYYLRKSSTLDEKSLSKLSVPSFLTVFGLLCQDLQLSDTQLALSSARTEMRFEAWRTSVEDFPEIVLQAVYLFGHQAPPTCPDCAYGFVLVSLAVSIATSCPGLFRLYSAFSRYTTFRSEVQASSLSCLDDTTKKNMNLRDTTEHQEESTANI